MTTGTLDISDLNGATFSATESSVLLQVGDGLVDNAGTYLASQNANGDLATFDTWDGNTAGPGSQPQPTDIVSYHTTAESVIPTNAPFGVVEYTYSQENGQTFPASGGTGAEVVAWNSTGVLLEQLTAYAPDETTVTPDGQYLILTAASVDLSAYDGSGGPTTAELTFTDSGPFPTLAQCFAAGTRIARTAGETAVEALRVGDRVRLADGSVSAIVWVGSRRIECRSHPDPDKILPIRIASGTFGEGAPGRPLFLSPDHAVFINGALIPVRLLVNGSTIRQVERATVTYYHIELERHAVLLAEGLPAESFLDTGGRSWFGPGTFAPPRARDRLAMSWECLACAPLVQTGPRLAAARRFVSGPRSLERADADMAVTDATYCHLEFAKP